MKINNKFELGSKVFYPSADLGNPSVLESTITGVSYYADGEVISYRTEHSYGVREEHLSKSAEMARKTLIKLMEDKRDEFLAKFEEAIKLTKSMPVKDLLNRIPNETSGAAGDPDGEI